MPRPPHRREMRHVAKALHATMRALPQIAQHAARCNRLQAFREGMSTTFVAILSFSPQLPQELHEHRTACRNRPGHGRPGQGHHRHRRIDQHDRQALFRRRHREHRRKPSCLPRTAADHAQAERLHLRRHPVRRNHPSEDQGRRAVCQVHGRPRHHPASRSTRARSRWPACRASW